MFSLYIDIFLSCGEERQINKERQREQSRHEKSRAGKTKARHDWTISKRGRKGTVRILDALVFVCLILRFGGSKGDPFANQKSIISEGFVNRILREKKVREKKKKRGRAGQDR